MDEIIQFIIHDADRQRIDSAIASQYPRFTRSVVKKWIDEARVTVNAKPVKPSYQVKQGDQVRICVSPPQPLNVQPQEIPLSIIYEDNDIIVLNKPAGLVVHPAPGHLENTLVNALLYHCTNLSGINGVLRPGIVHRLDKNTSGVLIVAKNDISHKYLAAQFAKRKAGKTYIALAAGTISPGIKTEINLPIGRHRIHRKKMSVNTARGKEAVTGFTVLRQYERFALLKIVIKTGRTHQIRVHLAHLGHPVIGDQEYGYPSVNKQFAAQAHRQMLHAFSLEITHPVTKKPMIFRAKMPEDMHNMIKGTAPV